MKIFYIIIFVVFFSFYGRSQASLTPAAEVKILRFYPNPAITQITFTSDKVLEKNFSLQIFNFIGKKVYESSSIPSKTVVNTAEFFRGVYIFQLKDKNGRIIESGKFQVSR